jgi:hypothetical protein
MEPYTPMSNLTEGQIREVKKAARRTMMATKTPKRLRDDCTEWQADVMSLTANDNYHLQGQVPKFLVTG